MPPNLALRRRSASVDFWQGEVSFFVEFDDNTVDGSVKSVRRCIGTNGAVFEVTLDTSYEGKYITYTTDGSDPLNGETYSGPFNVTPPFTLRAAAYSPDQFQMHFKSLAQAVAQLEK